MPSETPLQVYPGPPSTTKSPSVGGELKEGVEKAAASLNANTGITPAQLAPVTATPATAPAPGMPAKEVKPAAPPANVPTKPAAPAVDAQIKPAAISAADAPTKPAAPAVNVPTITLNNQNADTKPQQPRDVKPVDSKLQPVETKPKSVDTKPQPVDAKAKPVESKVCIIRVFISAIC